MYVLAATPTPITVTADKASACEGETITYSIKIGAVEHMQGFEFKVSIPTGLTYVSATVATGLKETLGSDKADWTESSKKFIVAGGGDYSSSSETAIMELKCTVDVGATVSKVRTLAQIIYMVYYCCSCILASCLALLTLIVLLSQYSMSQSAPVVIIVKSIQSVNGYQMFYLLCCKHNITHNTNTAQSGRCSAEII